jgi:hypothetical protein
MMKMPSPPAAATAMASLYARDKLLVERSFAHFTQESLALIDSQLLQQNQALCTEDVNNLHQQQECHEALAQACIRRIAYRCLDKYARLLSTADTVEDALKFYTLPNELQQRIATKYPIENTPPPTSWYEALNQLKELATTDGILDQGKLWCMILDHPMTSYVHMQCQICGHKVVDQYPLQQTDEEVGLKELQPTGDELELRAGWFRGPRKGVVFEFTCLECQHVSHWYRSGHPKVILNPNKWGRLCGDQEDLRLTLADYLKIPVRLVVPLDWDHVWSEYQSSSSNTSWEVQDGSARNFARRLDEGIGSWTRVWAISSNAEWCQDVTREYLMYRRVGGRADHRNNHDSNEMSRYKETVRKAQNDSTGQLTQAKTCYGYMLARANFTDDVITKELQRAATEYGDKEWWQL